MAFCSNCGGHIEDETKECPMCNAAPEGNNQNNKPVKFNVKDTLNIIKAKIVENKKLALAFGSIALVLVIVLIAILAGGKAYEKAIDNYIDVAFKCKIEKVKNLAPSAYWDYFEDAYDMDIDDLIKELKDSSDDILDALEEEYGKRIKVSYKVTDADKLDKDDLKDVKDALKNRYDIPKKSVTDAYELEIEMKIKGSEDEDEDEMEMLVVKIDGKWYVISESYRFMVPSM